MLCMLKERFDFHQLLYYIMLCTPWGKERERGGGGGERQDSYPIQTRCSKMAVRPTLKKFQTYSHETEDKEAESIVHLGKT